MEGQESLGLLLCRYLKECWDSSNQRFTVRAIPPPPPPPDSHLFSTTTSFFFLLVSPNDVLFVKPEVREGVLPRLLKEILDTRVMIKNAMKQAKKTDKMLYRKLDAQQYGLKMIANVTYGRDTSRSHTQTQHLTLSLSLRATLRLHLCKLLGSNAVYRIGR